MKLLRIFFILAIVAIVGLFFAWKKAPEIIASNLSEKMKVDVKIGDIALASDSVKITKIQIGNPKGSKLPVAFSTDSIEVRSPLQNYIKDAIVIDAIEINNIYMSLEFTSPTATEGNWPTIIDNLKKSSPPEEPKKQEEEKNGKSVLIKKLILTDINADLIYTLTGDNVQKLKTIPRLEFDNVSSESGISLDQIITLIMKETLESVLKEQSLGNILEKAIESPKDVLESFIPSFK